MLKMTFRTKLWRYSGKAAWFFMTIPKSRTQKIKKVGRDISKAWGSIPVNVKIGKSDWKTSVFPDSKLGSYLLPVKAEIRKKEGLIAGKVYTVYICIESDQEILRFNKKGLI